MEMSFKEKSAWISLISTLCIFGYYFYNIAMLQGEPLEQAKDAALALLSKAIILSIIVEVVFHSMLAATNHKAAKLGADERDKLFEYKANNIGYTILVIGVITTLMFIIGGEYVGEWGNSEELADMLKSRQIPLHTAHILMFFFILSEIVRFAGQIFYYRRGV
jgi:heme/copper-type cytochrome/quinol oxidase subunit 3